MKDLLRCLSTHLHIYTCPLLTTHIHSSWHNPWYVVSKVKSRYQILEWMPTEPKSSRCLFPFNTIPIRLTMSKSLIRCVDTDNVKGQILQYIISTYSEGILQTRIGTLLPQVPSCQRCLLKPGRHKTSRSEKPFPE